MGPVDASPPSSPDLYSTSGSDDSPPLHLPGVQDRSTFATGHRSKPRDGSIGATRQTLSQPLDLDMSSAEELSDSMIRKSDDTCVPGNAWNGSHKRKRELDPEPIPLPSRSVRPARLGNPEEPFVIENTGNKACDPKLNGARRPQTIYQDVNHAKTNDSPSGFGHGGLPPNDRQASSIETPVLSTEIWQHVCCFVPPVFLGRLLRVNRTFNELLTPTQSPEFPGSPQGDSPLRRLDAESIWAASRKRFCPGLPRPIKGCNELDMWRLLRGNDCQICGEKKSLFTTHESTNPWQCGPGQNGVRVIWPFGIRSCGTCIRKCSEKVRIGILIVEELSDLFSRK